MFYVSAIDGSQTVFDSENFRLLRQEQLKELSLRRERLGLQVDDELKLDEEVARSGGEQAQGELSSEVVPRPGVSSGVGVKGGLSSTAAGLAAAGFLDREDLEQHSSEKVKDTANTKFHRKMVEAVQPAAAIAFSVEDTETEEGLLVEDNYNPYQVAQDTTSSRQPAIVVSQIMSSPLLTLPLGTSLDEAQNLFREHRFRHIPVVDGAGKLVGILSDRDFIGQSFAGSDSQAQVRVDDLMTLNILTARPQTTIREIAGVMFRERIGSMPIIDEHGNLSGIVTRSDILRTVVNHAPLELWV